MLIGDSYLSSHCYSQDTILPVCILCGLNNETTGYIIFDCVALTNIRVNLFVGQFLSGLSHEELVNSKLFQSRLEEVKINNKTSIFLLVNYLSPH